MDLRAARSFVQVLTSPCYRIGCGEAVSNLISAERLVLAQVGDHNRNRGHVFIHAAHVRIRAAVDARPIGKGPLAQQLPAKLPQTDTAF